MIHYIKGILKMKLENAVVVETGGIGYEVCVPGNSAIYLSDCGCTVELFTYMQVREDDMSLYGFVGQADLNLFKMLITVNSVGAKAAMALLSSFPGDKIRRAIACEDALTLTGASGIGKKTAQKIVLDLKDKVEMLQGEGNIRMMDDGRSLKSREEGELQVAVEALVNLGYSQREAVNVLTDEEEGLPAEEYIKLALKKM